eukprot:3456005-Heterocapsa_arctica.AAC.1
MSEVGPSFAHYVHRNCPLDAVLRVLSEEAYPSGRRDIAMMHFLTDTTGMVSQQHSEFMMNHRPGDRHGVSAAFRDHDDA